MLEPYEQEDRRQAEWDRRCEMYPHCICCGRSVYCWDTYHTVADEFIFCENCYRHEEHRTEDLEVS